MASEEKLPLNQPLYIDTNIEYSMDPALFPGLDDPLRAAEPQLLIHRACTCTCFVDEEPLHSSSQTDTSSSLYSSGSDVAETDLFLLIESFGDSDSSAFQDTDPDFLLSSPMSSSPDISTESDIFSRLCEQLEIEVKGTYKRKRLRSDDDENDENIKRRRNDDDDCVGALIDDVVIFRGL